MLQQLSHLRETLNRAAQGSKYYARVLAGCDLNLQSIDEMRQLPILTRSLLMIHGLEMLITGAVPEYIRNTSGTTYGGASEPPLVRFISEEERRAWLRLHEVMMQGVKGPLPLAARLLSLDHGLDMPGAMPGFFPLPLEKAAHFRQIVHLLSSSYSFAGYSERIQLLIGSVTLLKSLTIMCLEHGVNASAFGVKLIKAHSQQLTPRWRGLLESYWEAEVEEVYGLSEVPGLYARRCDSCSLYHFTPLAAAEILDPISGKPVTSGVGKIIATGLYPLVSIQPIIRYDTEDIIEVSKDVCESAGARGFEFLGRQKHVILHPTATPCVSLLTPRMLNHILDDYPDIGIVPNDRAKHLPIRAGFGYQKYGLSMTRNDISDSVAIDLNIELCWSPLQYPRAAQELKAAITQRILTISPPLAKSIENKLISFNICFHEPGSTQLISGK
ncbi:Coenzyme F390 synthetase-like protein OS=Rhodospirillum rubrum F11 GN=F11_10105 PE=4 SV=1 [Gemmata massiliana]|uniref:Coenzyme F390 synthetase-like protein n=1 Tax=Gemmata massiliana TaxID=1210884 RepID=A0A6P2D4K6_9BACT|nr:hypothetical protein [Gemmata massiliana]VTR94350.1 Coenzyme F390 synthetase-like protein OS=Rhodospirillum rubrum F11 GN=F11_10105 PE=4 SV=1 [Gemmata massiliana]